MQNSFGTFCNTLNFILFKQYKHLKITQTKSKFIFFFGFFLFLHTWKYMVTNLSKNVFGTKSLSQQSHHHHIHFRMYELHSNIIPFLKSFIRYFILLHAWSKFLFFTKTLFDISLYLLNYLGPEPNGAVIIQVFGSEPQSNTHASRSFSIKSL